MLRFIDLSSDLDYRAFAIFNTVTNTFLADQVGSHDFKNIVEIIETFEDRPELLERIENIIPLRFQI